MEEVYQHNSKVLSPRMHGRVKEKHKAISNQVFHCCFYPTRACAAGVKQCLHVCVCVSAKKILKNASSRVAKAFTDVIVNEKQSA